MLYEIKINYKGNTKSYIATEIKFGRRDGHNQIAFLEEGKKRYSWRRIEPIGEVVAEMTVCEATTGREMYTFYY